jgi:heme A synthase
VSRRTWAWRAAGVVGCLVVTLALWAFWLEPASLTVAEHELSLDWPGDRSLRVAVLTDLHIGSPFNGMGKLHSTVDRTNAVQPDLICILGDLVIQGVLGGRFVTPEEIVVELARLHASAGIVAIVSVLRTPFLDAGLLATILIGISGGSRITARRGPSDDTRQSTPNHRVVVRAAGE